MIDIDILKEQNKLTISDNGLIYVKPIDKYNYITYPIEDLGGCLALTPEEYVLLKSGYYKIKEDMTGLEINLSNEINKLEEEIKNNL